jgi:hypothetical protein
MTTGDCILSKFGRKYSGLSSEYLSIYPYKFLFNVSEVALYKKVSPGVI